MEEAKNLEMITKAIITDLSEETKIHSENKPKPKQESPLVIIDYSCMTEWEMLIQNIQKILLKWDISEPKRNPVREPIIYCSEIKYLLEDYKFYYKEYVELEELIEINKDRDTDSKPPIFKNILNIYKDYLENSIHPYIYHPNSYPHSHSMNNSPTCSPRIQFGVHRYLELEPQNLNSEHRTEEMLLSALINAVQGISISIPVFLSIDTKECLWKGYFSYYALSTYFHNVVRRGLTLRPYTIYMMSKFLEKEGLVEEGQLSKTEHHIGVRMYYELSPLDYSKKKLFLTPDIITSLKSSASRHIGNQNINIRPEGEKGKLDYPDLINDQSWEISLELFIDNLFKLNFHSELLHIMNNYKREEKLPNDEGVSGGILTQSIIQLEGILDILQSITKTTFYDRLLHLFLLPRYYLSNIWSKFVYGLAALAESKNLSTILRIQEMLEIGNVDNSKYEIYMGNILEGLLQHLIRCTHIYHLLLGEEYRNSFRMLNVPKLTSMFAGGGRHIPLEESKGELEINIIIGDTPPITDRVVITTQFMENPWLEYPNYKETEYKFFFDQIGNENITSEQMVNFLLKYIKYLYIQMGLETPSLNKDERIKTFINWLKDKIQSNENENMNILLQHITSYFNENEENIIELLRDCDELDVKKKLANDIENEILGIIIQLKNISKEEIIFDAFKLKLITSCKEMEEYFGRKEAISQFMKTYCESAEIEINDMKKITKEFGELETYLHILRSLNMKYTEISENKLSKLALSKKLYLSTKEERMEFLNPFRDSYGENALLPFEREYIVHYHSKEEGYIPIINRIYTSFRASSLRYASAITKTDI